MGSVERCRSATACLAEQLPTDPHFDFALVELCDGVTSWYRHDLKCLEAFGDLGRMATVAAGMILQTNCGVTLTRIIALVSCKGVASPRRVRAICDKLDWLDAVESMGLGHDGREKPLRLGGWLGAALVDLLRLCAAVARPWIDSSPHLDLALATHMLAVRMDPTCFQTTGSISGDPVPFFVGRVAGLPILLELLASQSRGTAVSRKGLGLAYGVSRTHVAKLFGYAETQGWLDVDGSTRTVSLAPSSNLRLRHWVAGELAIMIDALNSIGSDG